MGWKGAFRSYNAAVNRANRAADRQRAINAKRAQLIDKRNRIEASFNEVEEHLQYLKEIISFHTHVSESIDWAEISSTPRPAEPQLLQVHQSAAKLAFETFKPGLINRLLGNEVSAKQGLYDDIAKSELQDRANYSKAISQYENELEEWKAQQEVSSKIMNGDISEIINVISHQYPFEDFDEYNIDVTPVRFEKSTLYVSCKVNDMKFVKAYEKKVLKSGQVSVRPFTLKAQSELIADVISSINLRVGRELLALFPYEKAVVDIVVADIDPKTGHPRDAVILSVGYERAKLAAINFSNIDPSSCLDNFQHNLAIKGNRLDLVTTVEL